MDKKKSEETHIRKSVTRNQIVTLQDLEIFKHELLVSIRALIVQYASPQTKKWLKTYEVKKLLDISNGTLQTLRNNGTIPFSKIGGTIYYDADEVSKVLEKRKYDFKAMERRFINFKK